MRLGIDLGATTTVAALGTAPVTLDDGPVLASAVTWPRRAVGTKAERALDDDPGAGVRGPLGLLESGASVVELSEGPVPVVVLLGALLDRVREAAGTFDAVTLATPPDWSPRGRHTRALRAAAALGGLERVELVGAPVAAAAWLGRDEDALAVCDLGGSGCRLSVVTLGAAPRLAATRELALGADLVEESVYVELLRMLGEHDPDAAEQLETLMVGADADETWRRCHAGLAHAARAAREALSAVEETTVRVGAPVEHDLLLRREQVRSLAERDLGPVAGALRELIARAAPAPRRCVLIGGAAPTPGFADLLADALEIPVEVADEPQFVIARGAAEWPVRSSMAVGAAATARSGATGAAGSTPVTDAVTQVTGVARVLAGDVLAAALDADGGVVIVRAHEIARLDRDGRVSAVAALRGGAVRGVHAAGDGVLVVAEELATVFGPGLEPLAARRNPLAGALAGGSAWIATGGDSVRLITYALARDVAAVVQDEPLAPARRAPLRRRRGSSPPNVATALGPDLAFAIAAGPGQVSGRAGADGLSEPAAVMSQPPWTAGFARVGDQVAALRGASLVVGGDVMWSTRDARAILLPSAWLVVVTPSRWELLQVTEDGVQRRDGGGGALSWVGADANAAWLVAGSTLVLAAADGSIRRTDLAEPLQPVGVAGERVFALRGTDLVSL